MWALRYWPKTYWTQSYWPQAAGVTPIPPNVTADGGWAIPLSRGGKKKKKKETVEFERRTISARETLMQIRSDLEAIEARNEQEDEETMMLILGRLH